LGVPASSGMAVAKIVGAGAGPRLAALDAGRGDPESLPVPLTGASNTFPGPGTSTATD